MDISHPSSGMRKNTIIFLHLPGTQSTSYQGNKYALPSSFKKSTYQQKKKKRNTAPLQYTCNYLHIFAILHLLVRAVIKSCAHLFCTRVLGDKKQKAKIHVVITHFQSFYINKVITSHTMLMNVLTLRQKLAKFENYLNGSCKIKNQTWIPNCYSTAATECTTSYTLIVTAHLLSCIL